MPTPLKEPWYIALGYLVLLILWIPIVLLTSLVLTLKLKIKKNK